MLARPVGSDLDFFESFGQGASGDSLLRDFDRPRISAGRMPEAADETMLSVSVADRLGLDVGDRVQIETFTPDGLWAAIFGGESFDYDGPLLDLRVSGIGQQPEEITGGGSDAVAPAFVVSDEFLRARDGEVGWFDGILVVRLEDGVGGMAAFEQAVRAEFPDRDDVGVNTSDEQARIEQAVDAQSLGLALLALVSAVAAGVAIGQAVARFSRGPGTTADLRALGLTSRERALGRTVTATVPVLAGGLVAAAVAVAASSAFPTGAAGRVEPSPGVVADAVVLLPGLALVVALAAGTAALATRRSPIRPRVTAVDRRLAAASLPVAVTSGLRAAFAGPTGRGSVPTRSAMIAGVAGVAGVVAAVVFGASLDRLTDTPDRYGWHWDFSVGLGDGLSDDEALASASRIEEDERIAGAMVARIDNIILEGREEFVYASRPLTGDLDFSIVAGRAADGPGEVALGRTTMDALDVGIGDVVSADGADGEPVSLEVVGQALFPIVENEDPARGAGMTLATYLDLESPGVGFPELYVRAAGGTDLDALAVDLEEIGFVTGVVPPPAITNLRGVDGVPFALAVFLTLLAVAATAHTLLTALRRRRQELAVLKTIGFVRRQVATTVVVQALAFGSVGLLIGLPLGLGVGRQAWRAVARGLGFATDVLIPPWAAMVVPGTVAVLLLVAAVPARTAARTPAADLLRSE